MPRHLRTAILVVVPTLLVLALVVQEGAVSRTPPAAAAPSARVDLPAPGAGRLAVSTGAGLDAVSSSVSGQNTANLIICKVAGPGVVVGTFFRFVVSPSTPLDVPAGAEPEGTCSAPISVTANANATVTETIPAGVSLVAVVADPQLPGFSANLATGVVTVPMDKALSTTYVTFTNQAAPTATPTRTATATATGTVATATPTATGTITTATPTATATVPPTGCILGDINCDGIVDIRDYGVWRQNFGQTTCGNPADLNTDCIVDIRDYGIWRANFGRTAGAAPRGTPGPAFVAGAPAVEASGHLLRAEDPGLAVPVLPLVGGLLGLGGLAGWRRRRPPSDRE